MSPLAIATQTGEFSGDDVIVVLNAALCVLFLVCYCYQFFYIAVPFFLRDKPHKAVTEHKIAVMISARNEEAVIKNLLLSLSAQTYPREKFTVFVAADNCSDKTASVATENGATVYERADTSRVGKGYALEFLYDKIVENFGENHFDAYVVLDADNVLDLHYLEEMNKTFSDGYEVLTSYRNSKNYGDNWISAGYALWFLRESEYLNHSRMLLGTSCAVSGTGFMFSAETIRKAGGWKFFLLTEDIEFTVYNVLNGKKIGYAKNAELFDEQPVTFPQSWRQRLRWAKGYIQVWCKYGGGLLSGIFSKKFSRRAMIHGRLCSARSINLQIAFPKGGSTKCFTPEGVQSVDCSYEQSPMDCEPGDCVPEGNKFSSGSTPERVQAEYRAKATPRHCSFEQSPTDCEPGDCVSEGNKFGHFFSSRSFSCYDMTMTIMPALVISILTILNCLVGVVMGLILGWDLAKIGEGMLCTLTGIYVTLFFIGALTTLTQWRKIHTSVFRKIFYSFTFPLFMLTYIPIAIVALCKQRVGWKPILHNRVKTLDEIKSL